LQVGEVTALRRTLVHGMRIRTSSRAAGAHAAVFESIEEGCVWCRIGEGGS
jgi:hypothetical protein